MRGRLELVAAFFTLAGDVSPWGGSLGSPLTASGQMNGFIFSTP